MQAGFERDAEQVVPSRGELNLVEAVAVAVVALQLGRITVSGHAELDRLRPAERLSKRRQLSFRPGGPLALDRLTQHDIAGEQIVRLERRRLIEDFEQGDAVLAHDPEKW